MMSDVPRNHGKARASRARRERLGLALCDAVAQPGVRLKVVICGLSITSSWGNGHATTYRALVSALCAESHEVLFLERDVEWYASNRDLPRPPYGRTELYTSVAQLKQRFAAEIRAADLVIVGSYVPEGIEIGAWVTRIARGVTAFYDIDTPVTLARLEGDNTEYISRALVRRYDLYLSFTGGPTLARLERQYGARVARALYCSVDPAIHYPEPHALCWDLGYMGTYSSDRQLALGALLLEPARRFRSGQFAVAGPQYPDSIAWPANVTRIAHLSPAEHRAFYNRQRFTLNLTRADMISAGYSPSVRLFEAAACGTAIISDAWPGLETFFELDREILIAKRADDVLAYLREIGWAARLALAQRARQRVLRSHTAAHRVAELVAMVQSLREDSAVESEAR